MDLMNLLAAPGYLEKYKRVFYVGYNTTFRTGIAINADPGAIAATEGCLSIFNNAAATSGSADVNTEIWPLYIKLVVKTALASGTDLSFRLAVDTVERYSSGGSALTTNECFVHSSLTRRTPKTEIYFGDLTLAAATSEKQVGQVTFHSATAASVVGDQYYISFGDVQTASALISASAAQAQAQKVQPVCLSAQTSLIMQPFATSAASTAGVFEVEVGFLELKRGD